MVRVLCARYNECRHARYGVTALKRFRFRQITEFVDDLSKPLQIDTFIENLFRAKRFPRVQPLWRERQQEAIKFGRRLLDEAVHRAEAAGTKILEGELKGLERMATLADEASRRTASVLQEVVRSQNGNTRFTDSSGRPTPVQTLAVRPLSHIYLNGGLTFKGEVDPAAALQQAQSDCQSLGSAIEVLEQLSKYAENRRDELADGYQNPGTPQKLVFVQYMSEGWIYLVGQKPTENAAGFAKFLDDGWNDVCADEAGDWRHSIRSVVKGFNLKKVDLLRSSGPNWR